MKTKEIAEIATEISEVFDNFSKDILNKIPDSVQQYFKNNVSDSYDFKYDKTKTLSEQKLSPKTKGIIAFLYKEYICEDEERQKYIEEYKKYLQKIEQDKIEFKPNEMFKQDTNNYEEHEQLLDVVQKEKWYTKFLNGLKRIFAKI